MAEIALEHLTKIYPDGTKAVTELDLEVEAGEFVVFVGPSGCGKTTALRMIAGLETVTSGNVKIDGQVVNTKMERSARVQREYLRYVPKYERYEKRTGFAMTDLVSMAFACDLTRTRPNDQDLAGTARSVGLWWDLLAAGVDPVSRRTTGRRDTPANRLRLSASPKARSRSSSTVRWCCSASTSVGAMNAACRPPSTASRHA